MQKRLIAVLVLPILLLALPSKKLYIESVHIYGEESISEGHILSTLRTKNPSLFSRKVEFDHRKFRLDAISVKNLYISKGFLNVSVEDSISRTNGKVEIFLLINEGKRFYVRDVQITGNTLLKLKQIQSILGIRADKPYDPVTANMSLPKLQAEYHRYGKLLSSFQILDAVDDSVDVLIQIYEGPNVFIQAYTIDGTGELGTDIVEREIMFDIGDLYNKDDMDLTQRYLLEAGVFSYAGLSPISAGHTDSLVTINIEVQPFKPSEFISEGGYYPIEYYEGAEPLPSFGVELGWKNRSLFKTTTSFFTKIKAHGVPAEDYIYPKIEMQMGLANQWFIKQRLPTRFSIFYESFKHYIQKDDPKVLRFGLNFSTVKYFNERSYIELSLQWEKFIEPEGLSQNIQQRSSQIVSRLDWTDDPLYPKKGVVLTAEGKIVGGLLGGNRSFIKTDMGIQGYLPIFKEIVLAGRVKYGMILGWDESDEVGLYDKFYLGGSSSMRGWDMLRFRTDENGNPEGDVQRFLTNMELRFPLFWLWGGEIFVDGGQLSDRTTSVLDLDLNWDAGFGIALITPILPFRADFAYPTHKNPKYLSSWKIQLGVQYIF